MVKMLIVEREADFAGAWRELFTRERYSVEIAHDGAQAFDQLRRCQYDVIIMETIAPVVGGIELCRRYRSAGGSSPVLLTTTAESTEEMVSGLDAGADDYMAKPIKLRELAARVRALLRRPAIIAGASLQIGELILDSRAGTVTKRGKSFHLHPMELNLLEFLMRHPNQVFSTQALLDRVWQDRTGALLDTVRTHIKTLRHKINEEGIDSIIVTVRGRGYKIVA